MQRLVKSSRLLQAIAKGHTSPPAFMVLGVWLSLTALAGYRTGPDEASANMATMVAMYELAAAEVRAGISIDGDCSEADIVEMRCVPSTSTAAEPMTYNFRATADAEPEFEEEHAAPQDDGLAANTAPSEFPARSGTAAQGDPLPFDPIAEIGNDPAAVFAEEEPVREQDAHAENARADEAPYDADVMHGHAYEPESLVSLPLEDSVGDAAAAALAEGPVSLGRSFRHFLDGASEDGELRHIVHHIKPGETISHVLGRAGLNTDDIRRWVQAAAVVHDLNKVFAGQEIALLIDTRSDTLLKMSFETGRRNVLVAELTNEGIAASLEEIPHYRRLRVVGAEIQSSLYMAAVSQGIPESIISDMAEILGWELNFAKDLQRGATFRVVYEELVRADTNEAMPGRVLAVDVTNRGRSHEGIYYIAPEGGRGGYYNRRGEALGRAFMRYPVKFSRISSHFSDARFHPVLKKNIPHYGVDFAAPTGTPVQAVADGTILMAKWHRGNGRFVKIKHDEMYQSGYAHLSKFAPGIEPGVRVRQGEVIGYVGMTGLATGPHLHFAIYRNGRYIDPINGQLPRSSSLAGSALASFEMALGMIDHAYAQAGFRTEMVAQLVADEGDPEANAASAR